MSQIESRITPSIIHDVRNVLANMISVSDLIMDDIKNDNINKGKTLELLITISQSSRGFLSFLEELLNISHSSNISKDKALVDVEEVINRSLKIINPGAIKAGVKITKDISNNLPPIKTISCKLVQILINLLDNSIKYNLDNNDIKIYAYYKNQKLYLGVLDNGIGISQERINKIMGVNNLQDIKEESEKHISSFSIGLESISKITRIIGCELEIESELSFGTDVRLIFPVC